MNKKLVLLGATLLLTAASVSAQKRVTGRVVDTSGAPVIGATIRVEGGKGVATTDANGNFTLNDVSASAKKLKVTYIGKKTESVTISGNVKVMMKDDEEVLGEAMVVAYGTATKSSFTGSAAQISGEKIENRVVSNVTTAMSGQMAGVQTFQSSGAPGSGSSIRIRGIGSMSASSNPLIILDGMPYEGSISSINPADIASISVLKDAASNAIYGARGANGVVLITTKEGREQDAVVTVDAKWGSNRRAVPNYKTLGTQNYYETWYRGLYNSQIYNGAGALQAHEYANNNLLNPSNGGLGYQVYTVPAGERFIGTNFKINPNATLGYSDGQYYYTPDDWYDEFFGDGNLRQEYNVNVAGRYGRLSYFASAGYLKDDGLVANSGFTRYTGRGRVDYQAKDWFRLGTNMSYTQSKSTDSNGSTNWNSSANLFAVTNMIAPIYPLYVRNADGSIMMNTATGTPMYDNGSNSTNFTRPFLATAKPGAIIANNRAAAISSQFNGKWYAEITPLEGLKLTANIAVNDVNTRSNNLYSRWGSSNETEDGGAYVSHSRTTGVNTQYLANYKTTFDEIHNVEILAGYESYKLRSEGLYGYNDHLYNPFIGELNNAHGFSKQYNGSSVGKYMSQGVLARVQYDYAGKYFASASFRRDASSRFHKDNRWGNFGSIGAAWLLSKESFMEDLNWIDMLKVKASWGTQGNDVILNNDGSINNYAYADQYSVTYSEETGEYAKTLTYKGNKNLTWEKSKAFNVGADFELFGNRLVGSIEYFSRQTSDMLYMKPTPSSAGIVTGEYPVNVGSMRNSGLELDLTGYIFKNEDFEWSVNFNATHYKNEILSLDPSVEANGGIKGSSSIIRVGGSLYQLYMVEYAGVDKATGRALFYKDVKDADGNVTGRTTTTVYSDADKYDLGDALPTLYGGFGTQLNWKGLDFSMQFAYQLGGKAYDGSYQRLMHTVQASSAGTAWHVDILDSWSPENVNSNIPRLDATANDQDVSSRFLTSSDYLAINNITIGYTLPGHWLKRANISSLRVYVSGDNLGVLSARQGFDPRSTLGGGSYASQNSSSNYSVMRNITGGITLTF